MSKMSIHPIETRYGRKEVKGIFDEENKLQKLLDVDAALARAHAKVGNIPKEDAREISARANTQLVKISRVNEIEREINHDLMAVVKALTEQCGTSGRYIHLGATSNDILDTALALQFKEYLVYLSDDLKKLKQILLKLTKEHKKTICIGRTHAQHAVPTTYGLKFAIYACEVQRHIDRLEECKKRILVGQMTGAVGTQAAFGEKGIEIQEAVMEDLGLTPVMVSNQLIQRERHAEFLLLLALIAQSLNKFAIEIRNLQRTEIDEISEEFKGEQVGSSTMPQKRNPIHAERVCGIARVIKANAIASLDNIPLWHERDLTNSSCERIIIPESCILTDYILNFMIHLFENLGFNYEKIKQNINLTRGMALAESVMISLTKKGMGRQESHELVRECAMECYDKNVDFKDVLVKNKEIGKYLNEKEILDALNPENYIGTAVKQVDRVLKELS